MLARKPLLCTHASTWWIMVTSPHSRVGRTTLSRKRKVPCNFFCVSNYPSCCNRGNVGRKESLLAWRLRGCSTWWKDAWWQALEAAGHMAPAVRKKKWRLVLSSLSPIKIYTPGLHPWRGAAHVRGKPTVFLDFCGSIFADAPRDVFPRRFDDSSPVKLLMKIKHYRSPAICW